jgi:hypothetical protein
MSPSTITVISSQAAAEGTSRMFGGDSGRSSTDQSPEKASNRPLKGAGNHFSNAAYEQVDPNQLLTPYSVYDDSDVDLLT